MTAQEIVDTVERMLTAGRHARSWTEPGGACCAPPTRTPENYCSNPAWQRRAIKYAGDWATEAAHEANRLLEIAS